MMRFLFLLLCGTGWIAGANAGLLERLDPNKRAEVTGQTVEFPTVNFNTVSSPALRTQSVSPVGGQRVDRNTRVTTQMVETKTVSLPTRDFAILPSPVVPQKNFEAKRAVLDQDPVTTPSVATQSAKIKSRVIRPYTPAGAQELQDQINRTP